MDLIEQCMQWCKANPRSVAFPDAVDERVLQAAHALGSQGLVTPVLVGDPAQIGDLARSRGCALDTVRIVDPARAPRLDDYAHRLRERMQRKAGIVSDEDARRRLHDPLWFGACMLAAGDVDAVIAGNVSSTADVLRAALRVLGPAPGVSTVSSLFFMISPDGKRVLGFADCGVVPQPNTTQLADIAISTADSFRNVTGETPRIAMLSFSTMGSVKHDAVRGPRDAVQKVRERRPDLLIEGELQFDAAFCPDVAARKVPDGRLGGRANIFVFPDLNAGNIAYKIAQRMGGYSALGPMIQGLGGAFHDLSRGCSTRDIVEVSLLAMKMSFGNVQG
ncbi:MAG: phosphate acetyltransferase [Castellaniella sp.]